MDENVRAEQLAAPERRAVMLSGVDDVPAADRAEVVRMLRAVVDGVTAAPDTTADPLHLAYLCGWADALTALSESVNGRK